MFFRREQACFSILISLFSYLPVMKTLQKITLVAFAVLSAGVAQAQCVNCAPPDRPTPPSPRDPGCIACSFNPNSFISVAGQAGRTLAATDNFSTVYQNGALQYACVDQMGPGNSADISQEVVGRVTDAVKHAVSDVAGPRAEQRMPAARPDRRSRWPAPVGRAQSAPTAAGPTR